MTIELTPELEAAVAAEAKRLGTTPEDLTLSALRAQFPALFLPPVDDWHARLRAVALYLPNVNFDAVGDRGNFYEDDAR